MIPSIDDLSDLERSLLIAQARLNAIAEILKNSNDQILACVKEAIKQAEAAEAAKAAESSEEHQEDQADGTP